MLRRYYLTLIAFFAVAIWYGFFAAWPLPPLGAFFMLGWIAIIAIGYFLLWRFTCTECGHHLIRNKLTFGEKEVWGISLLPPPACPSCKHR